MIAVLCGGVGAARFLRALRSIVAPAEVTAIVNTGDDTTLYGLRICPDLDTVMYTLGKGIDEERGWGRQDESWRAKEELLRRGLDDAYDAARERVERLDRPSEAG